MSNALKAWMDAATPDQKKLLAERAGTTVKTLYHWTYGRRHDGRAVMLAETALRLERAARHPRLEGLPPLRREDMATACSLCEFAAQCRQKEG